MNVSLISVSPDAEKHMAYCARVSNPNNQDNENYAGLLKYCLILSCKNLVCFSGMSSILF